ncbi:hypothetical protein NECID01_2046 [Nematocida sp. AWRm77]|nr:hypothetical protein NECID01_2046 [Nematocida sp. AWRm77]
MSITMNKTEAYVIICMSLILCFCASTIEVNFKLASEEEALTCRIPSGTFKLIENQDANCIPYAEQGQASSALKEKCEISLSNISTPQQYEHFKAFWETDLAALSAEDEVLSQYQADLTPDLFDSFLFTADFLEIQGEYAKRFAKNMVRYGLLGKHSKDITENSRCKEKDLAYDTFETMLPVFLRQTRLRSRTITHFLGAKKKTVLRIEKAGERPKQIKNKYTGPSQTTRRQTVLYSQLGPTESPEKERNEAVLVWLLLNMGGSSVDIQHTTDISSSEGIADLTQIIEQFTKENEKGGCVYVEGLSLISNCVKDFFSLRLALQLVPDLSRLELSIAPIYSTPTPESTSLISTITLCKSLKALKIEGWRLESGEISRIVESLSAIEQLSFPCDILDSSAIDSLKECTQLESLYMYGEYQPSTVVQALGKNLPLLKELSVECNVLEPAAAESFQACVQLEKLTIFGVSQPSTVVQALVKNLPLIKDLTIWCKSLEPASTESFKACTQLEALDVCGVYQPSAAVQALVKNLPLLRDLTIWCNALTPAAAEAFQTCTKLEKLNIYGVFQPNSAVQALLRHLPLLSILMIKIDTADFVLADAFRKCLKLRSLSLTVWKYTPDFLACYLQAPLPSLSSFELWNYDRNNYSEEDSRAAEKLKSKNVYISLIGLWY